MESKIRADSRLTMIGATLTAADRRATKKAEWLPIMVGLLVLYVPTFYDLSRTLWQIDDYAHGPIILAVIGWVFWQQREALMKHWWTAAPCPICGSSDWCTTLRRRTVTRYHPFGSGIATPGVERCILIARGWAAVRRA